MSGDTISSFRPIALLRVEDWRAAELRVLGLSVLERNVRRLKNLGFQPAFAEKVPSPSWSEKLPILAQGAQGPHLVLRGDRQHETGFFEALKRDIDAAFSVSRRFVTETGAEIASWTVPGSSGGAVTVCPDGMFRDAGETLRENAEGAARSLADALLGEIHRKTEGWIAKGLNKRISLPLTRRLVETNVSPNAVTLANFLLGLLGCLALLSLEWKVRAMGAFFIQLNSVIDGCDGELARLKVVQSKLGAWLDTITDDALNNLMLVCLSVGYYREFGDVGLLIWCLATAGASLGVSFFIYHYLVTHGTQNAAHYRLSWQKEAEAESPGKKASWFDAVKPLLKRDFTIFIAFALVLFDLRLPLIFLFAPVWAAFCLYLASFVHSLFKSGNTAKRLAAS